jgi:plastocyanin
MGGDTAMGMGRYLIVASMTVAAIGAIGFAVEAASGGAVHEIIQKKRSFGAANLSAKIGDRLVFVNGDPYAHNVYSVAPKGWLDLGIQEEGDRGTVVLDARGNFDIRCRIHPKMRVMVTVE